MKQDMIRQAITTKYIGPTNFKGSRVKAIWRNPSGGLTVTLNWDYALNSEENHRAAAEALMAKYGWDKKYDAYQGGLDSGYAFVLLPKVDDYCQPD